MGSDGGRPQPQPSVDKPTLPTGAPSPDYAPGVIQPFGQDGYATNEDAIIFHFPNLRFSPCQSPRILINIADAQYGFILWFYTIYWS